MPTQEPWEIRIGWLFSCRRWDDLLISKGAILLNSHCWIVLGVSSWINCSALGLFRQGWMKYLNYWVRWILNLAPPHSHPVSSLRPRLASLFWASRNCWRAFARGTSSWKTCRVLMVMRVQKIWKNVIVKRLNKQSASAEKSNTHACCKALGNFGVATIQNDAATNHHHWWHLACTRIFRYRYGSKWHAMKCLYPSLRLTHLSKLSHQLPRLQVSPSPSHAWALDGRGTKEFKGA